MMYRFFLLISLFLLPSLAALAQEADPSPLGKNGAWEAYEYKAGGRHLCYILSNPEGGSDTRKPAFAFITHRPKQRQFDEVTLDMGYTLKPGSSVTLRMDNQEYRLSTDKQRAWADDVATDKKMVAAMQRGAQMEIEGVSADGKTRKETFSLKGFTASYRLIGDECR
jgi:invasion protein IalB